MTRVAGKAALITGGAGAIGQGLAQALCAAGARVALADRDGEALGRAAQALADRGVEAITVKLDVTSADEWDIAIAAVERQLGTVQLLFNNAGVSALGVPVEDLAPDYWQRVIAINLTGVVLGVQAFLARLRVRGLEGHIVNTSSIAGLGVSMPGASAYCASKAGVTALTEVLEQELKPSGVGVSLLCPGPVRSELWRTSRGALGLADLAAPPADSLKGSAAPDAMDPAEVGRLTVEAVEQDRFYVITHPAALAMIDARQDRMRQNTLAGAQEG